MKPQKLEKKTIFVFKKNIISLSDEQMRRINGGNVTNNGGFSGDPGCPNKTIVNQTIVD